jgi:hypothetical protein
MSDRTPAGDARRTGREKLSAPAQLLLVGGSLVRIAYGVGALLAPAEMVAAQFAPDTHGLPEPRLLLRAFGGHQLVTGGLTLAATRSPQLARRAAALSLLIDAFDVTSALLELRARGHSDRQLIGGVALSGSGIVTFAAALRASG